MCLCIQNQCAFLELLVHLIFQHAHEILAFFKHIINLDYKTWRAEIYLCFLIYIICLILSTK